MTDTLQSGVQGLPGSYTHTMHKELFNGQEPRSFDTFAASFAALEADEIGRLTVAYANNAVGFIPEPYAKLTSHQAARELFIDTEGVASVRHCLMVPRGITFEDITQVHSQTPAIDQSSNFLNPMRSRGIQIIEQDDTAKSALYVSEHSDQPIAAIASQQAAELYGLCILHEGIQNDPDNLTRFVSVTKRADAVLDPQANITNALMTIGQHSGSLHGALGAFASMGIDLRFINSRLVPNSPFKIDMVVEFKMGLLDPKMPDLVGRLAHNKAKLDILGSFVSASNGFNHSGKTFSVDANDETTKYTELLTQLGK